MKVRVGTLVIAAALASEGCARGQAPAARQYDVAVATRPPAAPSVEKDAAADVAAPLDAGPMPWRTLLDRREQQQPSDKTIEARVKALVDRRAVLQQCDGAAPYAPAPSAVYVSCCARGSFVHPSAKESFCVVDVERCEHADGTHDKQRRLVVLDQEKIVANLEVEAYDAYVAGDLDSDGVDEVVLVNGGTGQGISTSAMTVVSVRTGAVSVIRKFDLVELYTCKSGAPDPHDEVPAYFWRIRDGRLHFREELYRRECDEGAKWILDETKEH